MLKHNTDVNSGIIYWRILIILMERYHCIKSINKLLQKSLSLRHNHREEGVTHKSVNPVIQQCQYPNYET